MNHPPGIQLNLSTTNTPATYTQEDTLKKTAERRALPGVQVDPANTSWRIDDPGLALRKKKIPTPPAKNGLLANKHLFVPLFAYKHYCLTTSD